MVKHTQDPEAPLLLIDDISDLKATEEDLVIVSEGLKRVFALKPSLYFLLEQDGTIVEYRAVEGDALYLPPETFLGKKMQEVLPPTQGQLFHDAISAIRDGIIKESTIEYTLPIENKPRTFRAHLITFSEHRILVTVEDAVQLNEERAREFVWNVSHDKLFEIIPAAVILIDKGRRIIMANHTALEIMGYEFDEVIGKECTLWFRETCGSICRLYDEEYEKPIRGLECLVYTKSGEERVVLKSVDLLRDHKNDVIGGIEVFEDITERKKNERRLSQLSLAVEQNPASIVITDVEGDIEYVNKTFTELTGYTYDEVYGKNPRILKSEHHDAAFYQTMWDTILKGNTWRGEVMNKKKNGQTYWEFASISPLRDTNGTITNFIGIKENITQRKLAEEEIRIKTQELETINNVIRAGNESFDQEKFYSTFLNIVVDNMDYEMAAIYLIDEARERLHLSYSKGYEGSIPSQWRAPSLAMPRFSGFVAEQRPMFLDIDTLREENCEQKTEGGMLGFIPITSCGTMIGALAVVRHKGDEIPLREILLLQHMINEADTAITKLLAEEQLKEYTDEIEENLKQKIESIKRAQKVQQSLNTKRLPVVKDAVFAACYMPCEELGGDFFDIRDLDGKIAIIIADCVGHGIESSMDATLVKSLSDRFISFLASKKTDVFLSKVNEEIIRYFFEENFPTMFVCVYDRETHEITYSNANSEMPFLISEEGIRTLDKVRGFHLGYASDTTYDRKTVTLTPGETLLLYSDALVEIKRGDGTLFPVNEIERIIVQPEKSAGVARRLDAIINEVGKLRQLPLEDDTTLILMQVRKPTNKQFRFATTEQAEETREHLIALLHEYNYDPQKEIPLISVAYEEMYQNAILHGNNNDSTKTVFVDFTVSAENAVIRVEDEGEGFNPDIIPNPTDINRLLRTIESDDASLAHGRGIWITREYMDKVSYTTKGNTVTMERAHREPRTIFRYAPSSFTYEHEDTVTPLEEGETFSWSAALHPAQLVKHAGKKIMLDFSTITVISSREIALLLIIIQRAREHRKHVFLKVENGVLAESFEKMQISKLDCVTIVYH